MGEETAGDIACDSCSSDKIYWDKVSASWRTLENYWTREDLDFDSHAQKMCMDLIHRHTRTVRIDTTIRSKFRHFSDLPIGGTIETIHLDLEV